MATLVKVENNHSDIIKSRLALSVSIKGDINFSIVNQASRQDYTISDSRAGCQRLAQMIHYTKINEEENMAVDGHDNIFN